MLQANKASVLTSFHVGSVNVQYMEVEYFMMVFNKITSLASLLSGFAASAFLQSTGLSETEYSWLKLLHVICTSSALGFMLLVLVISTLCTMWAPGLALRGSTDSSLRKAVDVMHSSVNATFRLFSIGLACYLFSSILSMILLQPTPSRVISVVIIATGAVFILRAGLQVIDALSPGFTTYAPIQGDPLLNGYLRADRDAVSRPPFLVVPPEASPYIQVCGAEKGCKYYESQTDFSLEERRSDREGMPFFVSQVFPLSRGNRAADATQFVSPRAFLSTSDESNDTLGDLAREAGQHSAERPGTAGAATGLTRSPDQGAASQALSSSPEGRGRTSTGDTEEAGRSQGASEYPSPGGTHFRREESNHGAARCSDLSGDDESGSSQMPLAMWEKGLGNSPASSRQYKRSSPVLPDAGNTQAAEENSDQSCFQEHGPATGNLSASSRLAMEKGGLGRSARGRGRVGDADSLAEPRVDSCGGSTQPFFTDEGSLFQSSWIVEQQNFEGSDSTDEQRRHVLPGRFSGTGGPQEHRYPAVGSQGFVERGMEALLAWLLREEDSDAGKEPREALAELSDTKESFSTFETSQKARDTTRSPTPPDPVYRRRGVGSTEGLGQEREMSEETSSGTTKAFEVPKQKVQDAMDARRCVSASELGASPHVRAVQGEGANHMIDLLEEDELFLGAHQLAGSD